LASASERDGEEARTSGLSWLSVGDEMQKERREGEVKRQVQATARGLEAGDSARASGASLRFAI
jgi:hypothetical protein